MFQDRVLIKFSHGLAFQWHKPWKLGRGGDPLMALNSCHFHMRCQGWNKAKSQNQVSALGLHHIYLERNMSLQNFHLGFVGSLWWENKLGLWSIKLNPFLRMDYQELNYERRADLGFLNPHWTCSWYHVTTFSWTFREENLKINWSWLDDFFFWQI